MANLRHRQLRDFESLEPRNLLSATPSLLADVNPGDASSTPAEFTDVAGTVFFTGENDSGQGIWKTDGHLDGTQLVKGLVDGTGIQEPSNLAAVGETLYFAAADRLNGSRLNGVELWKSDGTAEGTILVKDIHRGKGFGGLSPAGSFPKLLTNVSGTLFFVASTEDSGPGLWKSDGTAEGTTFVKRALSIAEPTAIGDRLFFAAQSDEFGHELWISDGTTDGTHVVSDAVPGRNVFDKVSDLSYVGETLYFLHGFDGKLWKSDGTEVGTTTVPVVGSDGDVRVVPFSDSSFSGLVQTEDENAYFFAKPHHVGFGTSELGVLDVETGEFDFVQVAPGPRSGLVPVADQVFFRKDDKAETGAELWKSDGTVDGTGVVKDIREGGDSHPNELTAVGDPLYFTADDGIHGRELWRSDGTSEGTVMVADINPDGSSDPQSLTLIGDRLYFSADDGEHGREPWVLEVELPPLPGDVDGNDKVEFADFLVLSTNFGQQDASREQGDFTGDGVVDFADFLILSNNFGRTR